jgi:hypothetical protein
LSRKIARFLLLREVLTVIPTFVRFPHQVTIAKVTGTKRKDPAVPGPFLVNGASVLPSRFFGLFEVRANVEKLTADSTLGALALHRLLSPTNIIGCEGAQKQTANLPPSQYHAVRERCARRFTEERPKVWAESTGKRESGHRKEKGRASLQPPRLDALTVERESIGNWFRFLP